MGPEERWVWPAGSEPGRVTGGGARKKKGAGPEGLRLLKGLLLLHEKMGSHGGGHDQRREGAEAGWRWSKSSRREVMVAQTRRLPWRGWDGASMGVHFPGRVQRIC